MEIELQDTFAIRRINIYLWESDHDSLFNCRATFDCFMRSKQERQHFELRFATVVHEKYSLLHVKQHN